jgi:superfamily II RNA helicase
VARDEIVIEDEPVIAEYYDIRQQIEAFKVDIRTIVHHPQNVLRFLQAGRLVRVKDGEEDFGWGVIINYQKTQVQKVTIAHVGWAVMLIYFVVVRVNRNRQPARPMWWKLLYCVHQEAVLPTVWVVVERMVSNRF